MVFAVVYDVAASWERYAPVAEAVSQPSPAGLVALAAGPTDEGVRIISLWEHESWWHRFLDERLGPAVAALDGPPAPPAIERHLTAVVTRPLPDRAGD